MSHELSFVSGKAECFVAGEPAWHGQGINVKEAVTAKEAIGLAGLDWEIEQEPLFLSDGTIIGNRVANVRRTPKGEPVILGTVSDQYVPVQNHEAFKFFDTVVGSGQAIYNTAGALFEGRKIWILAKLPGYMTVGRDDVTEKYLLLVNGNDGASALKMFFTPVRVVCNNTLTTALGNSNIETGVNVHHTGDVAGKVEDAAKVLKLANDHFRNLENHFNDFNNFKISDGKTKKYFKSIFPESNEDGTPTKVATKRLDLLFNNYQSGRGAEKARGTLWGAYNAVTEFTDHTRYEQKKKESPSRFTSSIFGNGMKIKQRAFDNALTLVNA